MYQHWTWHVLLDKYLPDSLKGSEQILRGAVDQPFVTAGSGQASKQTCKKALAQWDTEGPTGPIFSDRMAESSLWSHPWPKNTCRILRRKLLPHEI